MITDRQCLAAHILATSATFAEALARARALDAAARPPAPEWTREYLFLRSAIVDGEE